MIHSGSDVNSRTIVSRLRVHSRGLDPLSARLRVESQLAAIDWRPPNLPPAAVLVVRRLRDPRPGLLILRPGAARPTEEWSREVMRTLERLCRTAARPALEPVPLDAEAIVFQDRAELLACLALDHLSGEVADHWWWRMLLETGLVSDPVSNAWMATPRYVPAALQHLAARGRAVAFVRTLTVESAGRLADEILRDHGLDPMLVTSDQIDENTIAFPMVPIFEVSTGVGQAPEPWADVVPEACRNDLQPARRYLLGIALMLRRAPTIIRSRPFLLALVRWKEVRRARAEPPVPGPEISEVVRQENDDSDRFNLAHAFISTPLPEKTDQNHARMPQESSPSNSGGVVDLTTCSEPSKADAEDVEDDRSQVLVTVDRTEILARESVLPTDIPAAPAPPALDLIDPGERDAQDLQSVQVETDLGGIFYLINLALFIGLYADFTRPRERGLDLSIWDLLVLLGERLLGHGFGEDPIGPLLAKLAGRAETEPPGLGVELLDEWRLPIAWLETFPEPSTWTWTVVKGRLRVVHAEGFAVLDIAVDESEAEDRLREELRVYSEVCKFEIEREDEALSARDTEGLPSLERWFGWLLPFVKARLSRAMGWMPDESMGPRLLGCHARLAVTATHLDLFLSLQELPIEVRLAGLDRDPGWVPAAGRTVKFHFD